MMIPERLQHFCDPIREAEIGRYGLCILAGYLASFFNGDDFIVPAALIGFLRREQMKRLRQCFTRSEFANSQGVEGRPSGFRAAR